MSPSSDFVTLGYIGKKNESFDMPEAQSVKSKIGGLPDWLKGSQETTINCSKCHQEMTLVVQLFTPYTKQRDRCIYLHLCCNSECGSIWKVVRLSIAKEYGISDNITKLEKSTISNNWLECAGLLSDTQIDCYSSDIDSNEVNSQHNKKFKNKYLGLKTDTRCLPCYLIECDFENIYIDDMQKRAESLLSDYLLKEGEVDLFNHTDLDVSDSESNESTTKDPLKADESIYVSEINKHNRIFSETISRNPSQIIRYSFGGKPLWSESPKNIVVNNCENCGAPRVFEFQLLSTLIYELSRRNSEDKFVLMQSEDWATIVVFTCSEDCVSNNPLEEYCVIQYI
ncbi:hypothetical protein ACR3K2_14510 [Cryptosporidium serpentis]